WQQVENAAVGACYRSIKLPAWENSSAGITHGLLYNLRRSSDAFSREPGIDRAQQFFRDWSLCQRQEHHLIDWIRGPLTCGIKLAHRFDFIPEKFDANRTIGFRGIHVEDAASSGVLARHLDHIGGTVADRVQMLEQLLDIENFAATQNPRQISVVLGRA